MEDKLKFIYENIQDVVWVMDIKTKLFTYVSPSISSMRGYTPDEVMGFPLEDTLTPASKMRLSGLFERLIQEYNQQKSKQLYIGEFEQYHKDGSTVWTEVVGTFIENERDEIVELLGVSRNITERKKELHTIEENERKLRELTDFLPQIVYELDEEGYITFTSRIAYDLFDFSKEDIFQKRIKAFDMFIPSDRERMIANRESVKSGKSTTMEFTALGKNGRLIPVIIYASPKYSGGKSIGSRGIIVDISERKEMESQLRRSEEKYRVLIQSLQEGLFVIQDGKFTYLNESVVKIVGYSVDELKGMEFLQVVAPEMRELISSDYVKRINGEDLPDEFETNLLHKDGTTRIPVIISVSITEFEGKQALIGTAKDISLRTKAENESREKQHRLNAILDAALVGIAYSDNTGKLIDSNKKWLELFGYEPDEMYNFSFADITYNVDVESSRQFITNILAGKINNYNMEKRYVRKNGTVFWGEVSVRAIMNSQDEVIGLVASVFDLTERKRIEEELVNDQKRLKLKLEKETIRSQFETLKNQVNPHFLFNSLNVLSSLISQEPLMAEKFTEQLSKVYRYVLENKDNDTVPLSTEIDFINSYTFLLEIRFKDKVRTKINIEEKYFHSLIPTLALQLLIENAIKHNTFSKKQPLTIDIFIDCKGLLCVENNYQFRQTTGNLPFTGIGLQNILNRYSILSDKIPFFGIENDKFTAKLPLL